MKLVYPEYNLEMTLQENQVIVLAIENQRAFSKMLAELWSQVNGGEGSFVLSQKDKIEKFSRKSTFVMNPFSMDCNEKKIINKLYQELNEISSEKLLEKLALLNNQSICLIDEAVQNVPYQLQYDLELDFQGLLKLYNVKIESNPESILEKIMDYLRVMHQICGIEIVFFLNLKQYLTEEELKGLYEFVFYEKIYLIEIEGNFSEEIMGEKWWILDKDLCIIEKDELTAQRNCGKLGDDFKGFEV